MTELSFVTIRLTIAERLQFLGIDTTDHDKAFHTVLDMLESERAQNAGREEALKKFLKDLGK